MNHKEHICRFNDGEQTCECYDKGFEAGRNSMKEEILSKLPEETKDIKNSGESRVSGAMYALEQGRNFTIQQVKEIIKNIT